MTVNSNYSIAVVPGDGIGVDVITSAQAVLDAAQRRVGGYQLMYNELHAGAKYYQETGRDISEHAFKATGEADAILLGAIGLPSVRYPDGTEITPHLRMRDAYQLYAGVRPVKAYPNSPQRLADPRAAEIDFIVLRESTEGLFYSRDRAEVIGDSEVRETLRITRATTEKLHDFAFRLAQKRKVQGKSPGKVTCVDKANVFTSMAFFRKIFDERAIAFPDIETSYAYVDAQALDLIRKPWDADVLVMENMFGDILSDLGGGLVGGMGMAACAEIGDQHALFQPAHGSAPDIMGQDKANPLATILSAALMLDYLSEVHDNTALSDASTLIGQAIEQGFEANQLRPVEFGGDMGTQAMTAAVIEKIKI